jgi:phosphoglycolate phosphatase
MNRVLKAHRYPVHAVEDYKLLVGKGLDNLVTQALPVPAQQPAMVSIYLAEMIEDYGKNCLVNTCLYEGIRELLDELSVQKMKLAVFSNKTEPLTHKIVGHLLGDIKFVQVIGARPGQPKKPDPAGALYISEQMGIIPCNLIYMGDSDVDMMTATRAGMYAVGVLWGFRTAEELMANGARKLLNHPLEMLDFMAKY